MAKLNVVIPAVEVTVDGVTYRKVDRKAQAGDIVKALNNGDDIDMGAFYAVYVSSDRELVFADDNGDERAYQLRENSDKYEVYAPISEPAADTITFEGATWRKVDRDVREGDAIKFTGKGRRSYLTGAELYVVDRVDSCDDPQITDDDGDDYDAGSADYEVYEKVAEEKTQVTTPQYREVKRKADVGERIKIVDRLVWETRYANGDTFVVAEDAAGGDVVIRTENFPRVCVVYSEYVVLEPVTAEPAKKAEPERLAVGDYARVVDGEKINSGARVGDIVEILVDDKSTVPYKVRTISGYRVGDENWALPSAFVRATDEEVAAAKDPRSKFEIGDYVKVAVEYCEHKVGDVLKITNTASRHDFYVTNVATNRLGCIDADKLVKLTAAEIAEIERKQAEEAAKRAEEARWNAIGRKVNEYKRGDLVKVLGTLGGETEVGDIVEVYEGDGTDSPMIYGNDGSTYYATVELIVPVEQRFDRVEEVDAA